jgi:methanogenic corrinoid protein MtbC1
MGSGSRPNSRLGSAAWSIPLDDGVDVQSNVDQSASLARLIEIDVVPGLILAHRTQIREDFAPSSETIEEFTALVLAEDSPALSAYIENLHLQGASFEALYLGLLSATARRLGEFWETDIVDFTAVTIGLWRLQELLRNFSPVFQTEGAKPAHGHRALLLSTPGEQHNFGLAMLGEFLFRDGWSIAGGPGLSMTEISKLIKNQFFSLVGLSLSHERGLDALTETIRMIRRDSSNRGVVIMVGGALFLQHPELVARVGADSTAPDARQGAIQAERLVNNIGVQR